MRDGLLFQKVVNANFSLQDAIAGIFNFQPI